MREQDISADVNAVYELVINSPHICDWMLAAGERSGRGHAMQKLDHAIPLWNCCKRFEAGHVHVHVHIHAGDNGPDLPRRSKARSRTQTSLPMYPLQI